ncbi:MAG: glutamate-5-semialdehyde dehydrogenase [Clostridia bacterium]|nr:glutamate-5-semialdehyde dehydrogenase [Clostridia bacterium]
MTTMEMLERAKKAKAKAAQLTSGMKNLALDKMAEMLVEKTDEILKANETDLEKAKGVIGDVMLDRLRLTKERILSMANGIREVMSLEDPAGKTLAEFERPNGLKVTKISVPLGVVAIIFESRPNVAADAAALCIKSGNVCVLRGGKEAYASVGAIVEAMRDGLEKAGLAKDMISRVEDITRAGANELMTARGYVDLLIPRGGAGLIRACVDNARVPVIETGTGICHIFVDESADFEKALAIIENAKTSRPSVCNAEEVLLVHQAIAGKFLPLVKKRLTDDRKNNHPVELRLDARAMEIIDGVKASDADFDTEFLDYVLAVGVKDDLNAAIEHISLHSTGHSDAIITEDENAKTAFIASVDSAAVYVNASTRFTDGGEFGLGCEMGISTQKLHARGPMGLEALTGYKYVVTGNGHIR